MLRFIKHLVLFLSVLQIAACSSTTQAYKETLELAFFTPSDHVLLREELVSRPYDSIYLRFDRREQAILTLGFIEQPRQKAEFIGIALPDIHKWVSSDQALVLTQGHRIIKTQGLPVDLWHSPMSNKDPLLQPLDKIRVGQEFQLKRDWSNLRQNLKSRYRITAKQSTTIEISEFKHNVIYISEDVLFDDGHQAVNEFWFSAQSGKILKTRQTLSPFFPVVELVFVSQAFREESTYKEKIARQSLNLPNHSNPDSHLKHKQHQIFETRTSVLQPSESVRLANVQF
jgi:hypothetical protein